MAAAAEVGLLLGAEIAVAFDLQVVQPAGGDGFDVPLSGTVTPLALNAGRELVHGDLSAADDAGGVTTEAAANVVGRHLASESFVDVRRDGAERGAEGLVESFDLEVVADAAFVELAVAFEHVGLAGLAVSK